jgi:ADP-ribose pyrophosphatase
MEPTKTREAYRNKWMTVREHDLVFPDGSTGMYGVVEKPDFALVIPQGADGRFCLVEQYRYPVGRRAWEFPQGSWSGPQEGGAPEALAATELREETGLTAGTMHHLGRLNPEYGFCNHAFDAYLATDLAAGQPDREVSEQDMVQAWFSEADLVGMVRSGEITDAASVAAFLLLLMDRGSVTGHHV